MGRSYEFQIVVHQRCVFSYNFNSAYFTPFGAVTCVMKLLSDEITL